MFLCEFISFSQLFEDLKIETEKMESLERGVVLALEGQVDKALSVMKELWDNENSVAALLSIRFVLLMQKCQMIPGWVWGLHEKHYCHASELITRPRWLSVINPLGLLWSRIKLFKKEHPLHLEIQLARLRHRVSSEGWRTQINQWFDSLWLMLRLNLRPGQKSLARNQNLTEDHPDVLDWKEQCFRLASLGFHPAQRTWIFNFADWNPVASLTHLLEWTFHPEFKSNGIWRRDELALSIGILLRSHLPKAPSLARPWFRVYAENNNGYWENHWEHSTLGLWPVDSLGSRSKVRTLRRLHCWSGCPQAQYYHSQSLLLQLHDQTTTSTAKFSATFQVADHWLMYSSRQNFHSSLGFLGLSSPSSKHQAEIEQKKITVWGPRQYRLGVLCVSLGLNDHAIHWFDRAHRHHQHALSKDYLNYYSALLDKSLDPSLAETIYRNGLENPSFISIVRSNCANSLGVLLSSRSPQSAESLKQQENLFLLSVDFFDQWEARVNLWISFSHPHRYPSPDLPEAKYHLRIALRDHPQQTLDYLISSTKNISPEMRSDFRLLASLSHSSFLFHPSSFASPLPPPQ